MSRLHAELSRLYHLPQSAGEGLVRTLVLELARPADWVVLAVVWRGVQADLEWPAPAIAVSGTEGLQLWFSLAEPVPAERAVAVLAQLRARYLPEVAAARVRLWPSAAQPELQAPPVPAVQAGSDNWSAFVAPDLAPVFADTPWLDIPPGAEGQADLLSRLKSIRPAEWDAARRLLDGAHRAVSVPAYTEVGPVDTAVEVSRLHPSGDVDPRRFLQQVLNDVSVPLALRVEAAKALLPRD